jgi:hypothetical protein
MVWLDRASGQRAGVVLWRELWNQSRLRGRAFALIMVLRVVIGGPGSPLG